MNPGQIIESNFADCTPIKRAIVVGPDGKTREGALLWATTEPAKCGCRIVGNGTLPHPLKIEFCAQHRQTRIKIEVCGGMVQAVKCSQPATCTIYDHDNAQIGEKCRSEIPVTRLRRRIST